MDKILKELTEKGYFVLSEVTSKNSDVVTVIKFCCYKTVHNAINKRKGIVISISEYDIKNGETLYYTSLDDDRKLWYSKFANLTKEQRVVIMQDLWKKFGEYNIMLALRKYSSDKTCEYAKELFSFMFVYSDDLFTKDILKDLNEKPLSDKSIFVAAIKMLDIKLKEMD